MINKQSKPIRPIDANILVGPDGLFAQRGCIGYCEACNLHSSDGCRVILEAPTLSKGDFLYLLDPSGMALHNICLILEREKSGSLPPEYVLDAVRTYMEDIPFTKE